MLRTYLKIAFRNLWRYKVFSAINIFGLVIGLTTCLLIMQFVVEELSYDRFHDKGERIVRVGFKGSVQGEQMNEAHVMPPVAKTLQADYPEVVAATRLRTFGKPRLRYAGETYRTLSFAFVDSNFFQVFSLPLLKGNAAKALATPNSLVISAAAAQRLFGQEDPLGKVLQLEDRQQEFTVTGIMENIPANSHFQFDLLASMASFPEATSNSWMVSEFHTYLLLQEGYSYQQLEAKLPEVAEKYMSPQLKQAMGISLKEFRQAGNSLGLYLQPLTDIHLHSDARGDLEPGGDVRYVYIFSSIALFMLLIACINFMNLSTAGASKRAREVGVRKVLGSGKRQLVGQFLIESILLTLVSMGLALLLVELTGPLLESLTGRELEFSLTSQAWLIPYLLMLVVVVGILAGGYPAFFLSSFNTIAVLKGATNLFPKGDKSGGLRSGLVVFQFMISIVLIIGTLVVYQQLQYMQSKELGYDKEQVLVLAEANSFGNTLEAFRQQLLQDSRVAEVSTSGYLPAGPSYNNNFFVYPDAEVARQVKTLRYDVDEHYIAALGMQLLRGRNFSSQRASDSTAIILNETAARAFGWGNNAVGKTLTTVNNGGEKREYRVIGLVQDFHFRSLHERIAPLVMVQRQHPTGAIIVKTNTADMKALLADIEKSWTAFNPGEPFRYSFLDERFQQAYEAERKLGLLMGVFACLTIFVACLGLFGLVLFTAERRTKEIGIRKVLGASAKSIFLLLSMDFLKLLGLAFIMAAPLAAWVMGEWLQDFAYRISISWWMFALAGLAAVAIALLTISIQAIRAAVANPVTALRSE